MALKKQPAKQNQSLMDSVLLALQMPKWLVQPLSAVVYVVVGLFVLFQIVTANPYGNRAAEAVVSQMEKSAGSLQRSADSLEKIANRIEAVERRQLQLDNRVTVLEKHVEKVDNRFHKSLDVK